MVTAEFAAVLPAVVLVLGFIVALGQTLLAQQQAGHAASVAVRVAARGESDAAVRAAAAAAGSPDSVVVRRAGGLVTVDVIKQPGGVTGWLLPDAAAQAVALEESISAQGAAAPIPSGGAS